MATNNRDYNRKSQRIQNHGDYISNLPDDTISNILSHLSTKDAVRTCVLSRNWEHNWTSIYNIDIRDECDVGDRLASFITFVDRVLLSTVKTGIKSFRLVCDGKYTDHHLSRWVSNIVSRGVQVLVIQSPRSENIIQPLLFSSCDSLIDLNLSLRCTIRVLIENDFSKLKSLRLYYASINNEQSGNEGELLLMFPVLEVKYCSWLNARLVEIRASELLRFEVWTEKNINDCRFKICAPKLTEFISHYGLLFHFDLCAPSVFYVSLHHLVDFATHGPRSSQILNVLPCLSHLTLSGQILKALAQLQPGNLPIFHRLRRLDLFDKFAIKDLLELLQLVPSLEMLYVDVSCWYGFKWDQPEILTTCIVSPLKNIIFVSFSAKYGQIFLAKYFLENAIALERLFLHVTSDSCLTKSVISNILSKLPNSSRCVPVFGN